MMIKFRAMQTSDIDAVYEVETSAFSSPWTKENFRSEMKNKLARYVVAEDESGKIIGYIGCWYIIDEAHITNVAVHRDYQGKKVGGGLMEAFINMCERDKMYSITLEVRPSNIVAQNLYKEYGFLPGGVRKEYYSDNKEDALIMWKQIKEV